MRNRKFRFGLGFATGLLFSIACNLMPYARSYRAYDGDGYEVAGFPWTFRKVGGMTGTWHFSSGLLLADAVIGLATATLFGFAAKWLFRRASAGGRGFPIVP